MSDPDPTPDAENPYAAPRAPLGPPTEFDTGGGVCAALVRRSWIRRTFRVATPEGTFEVDYYGRGIGEAVYVDRRKVAHDLRSSGHLVAPRIDFAVGSSPAAVEVRVWPWLTVRGFSLTVGGQLVYAEGCLDPRR